MSGTTDGMTLVEMRSLLKSHFVDLLAKMKARIDEHGRLSKLDIVSLTNTAAIADQDVATDKSLLPDGDAEVMQRVIKHFSLPIEAGTPAYAVFERELKRAHRDYCKALVAYDSSLDDYDFTPESRATAQQIVPSFGAKGISLSELTDRYTTDRLRAGAWVKKTEDERAEHIALLHEILGADADVRALTIAEAGRVEDTVFGLPKNRNKNQKTRNLPLAEAIAVEGVDKLNVKTVNKYLQTYNDLFRWAKRKGHMESDAFGNMKLHEAKRKTDNARDAFSVDQVKTMLDELLRTGGRLVRKDYQKWGPLIGIYTGARLNEIAQIHLSDIRKEDGLWCFDINEAGEGKHLKNAGSRRLVPMHSRLIEIGLLEYVDDLRRSEVTKLFPDFTYDPQNGWGRALGRWFNERFLPKLGLKSNELVFHSLRHTVVTHLSQADVAQPFVQAIVGHAREGTTQRHYFKQGYKLSQLSEALHKLPF